VNRSENMPWYKGTSLLDFLETVEVTGNQTSDYARMPVQWVIRPQTDELHDYRGYAGRVLSGTFKVNDRVTVLPSGSSSVIDKIEVFDQAPEEVTAGMSVTLHLKDNIDISRGDVLVNSASLPQSSQLIEADLCWMDNKPMDDTITYFLQHNSKLTKCKVREILYIGRVVIKTADELAYDLYAENKANGSAILIDSRTNLTVGALMFRAVAD
jgi:sulfate adenylyltransferase subunit 1